MGLSSSSSSSTTKPYFKQQILDAANAGKGVFDSQLPKIQSATDMVTGLEPGLIDRYNNGDPSLNAASHYITSTLGGDPAHNPQLEAMIGQTDQSVRNHTLSGLGTRGLSGGSVAADIISRNLAQNETGLRYQDYNTQQQLRAQAAGMAPGVSAGQTALLAPVFDTAQASTLPLQASTNYMGAVGGLLGQYQKQKTTQSPSLLSSIGQIASAAAPFFG